MFVCPFCSKVCKSKKSLAQHQIRCSQNPNRLLPVGNQFGSSFRHCPPWNKGLTKESNASLQKLSVSMTKPKPDYQLAVDDDGKLMQRFYNKRVNARAEHIEFALTFREYCLLVADAGLVSSDLGFTGNYYVLARYNDIGPYAIDNCRFITQKQNAAERRVSNRARHREN